LSAVSRPSTFPSILTLNKGPEIIELMRLRRELIFVRLYWQARIMWLMREVGGN